MMFGVAAVDTNSGVLEIAARASVQAQVLTMHAAPVQNIRVREFMYAALFLMLYAPIA
jgi:hypothetical protein